MSTTEAFFDNLIELPMNMAGYMSVARASTECEDQVDLHFIVVVVVVVVIIVLSLLLMGPESDHWQCLSLTP